MAAPHAFLDILAHAQVRDAYLAGRITLILSPDLETVLWANGAGAHFIGFRTVAESLHAAGGFSAQARRSIAAALDTGAAFQFRGIEGSRDFLANKITLAPWGEAVFLRSRAASGRGGLVDLTEGLSDETSEAALVDVSGRLMYADKGFNSAILREAGLAPLLADAYRDGDVKKRFLGEARPYPVGVLRLNQTPPVLLLIAAKTKEEQQKAAAEAFVFEPSRLPARFVWASGADGVFTEVSPELAAAVGPLYADIAGKNFADLAKLWHMDKDGAVAAMLKSGNPWSGQALDWPVQGLLARARAELSALPIYSADKRFMGFRGFGLIEKLVDTMADDRYEQSEKDGRNLSREERQAFFTIAERLKQALPQAAKTPQAEDNNAELAAQSGGGGAYAQAKPPLVPAGDIFSNLAAEVRGAMEKDEAHIQAGAEAAQAEQQRQRAAQPAEPIALPQAEPAEPKEGAPLCRGEAELAAEGNADDRAAEGNADDRAQETADKGSAGSRRAEAELSSLHYQTDRLNFLLNAMSEAVLILDKTAIIRSGNEAAARLFGCQAGQLPGIAAAELFDADAAGALRRDIEQAEASGAGSFLKPGREARARARGGAALRLRLNFGCLEQGRSYFLLLRDMTRFHDIIASLLRQNSEERGASQRRSRYLALISHEIRTPLNALLGMAQFMEEEKAGPLNNEKYKDYLGDMRRAGRHILTLVNDILQVSREKAEWLKMDIKPIALFQPLSEVLALMIPQANAANIIMRSGVAADLPPVLADARAVRQILLNLIGNAVHFTPQGGQIIISAHELPEKAAETASHADREEASPPLSPPAAHKAGRRILLRVSDTGIGMSAAEIARSMRDPLESEAEIYGNAEARGAEAGQAEAGAAEAGQAEAGAAEAGQASETEGENGAPLRFSGAGLGLPMVRALAEANHLRFSLSSELGKGTIAALVFPAAETEKGVETAPLPA